MTIGGIRLTEISRRFFETANLQQPGLSIACVTSERELSGLACVQVVTSPTRSTIPI